MTPHSHGSLHLIALTPEQREQTCDYWYLLRSKSSPFTAFRSRAALEFYLALHRLELAAPLPDTLGTHAVIDVEGTVREIAHSSRETLPRIGQKVLHMSNGDYTLGIACEDDQGTVLHYVLPAFYRVVFDYPQARAHVDAGHRGPLQALIDTL